MMLEIIEEVKNDRGAPVFIVRRKIQSKFVASAEK
jgi:hypothetical protein